MKKILGLLLLLVSFTSFGQFVNYTNINGRYKWIAGKFDSTFTLPSGTTPSLRTGGGTGPGALFYNTADSIVYQYTGSQWRPLHGSDTGRIQIAYVRNTTASQMTTGQVVYINGSTGNVPTVALAQNKQDSSSAMTFGFVRGTIAVNGFGWITTFGPIDGINTNAYTEGEVIYLDSVAGQFTHSKPQAPYHMVTLGYIVKKAGNGIIFTKIQNGYELEELHNVRITAPVLNKSVIIYDSVNQLWVDTTVSAAGLGLGGSGTTNYLPKWTGSTALGNSLVYDNGTQVLVNTTTTDAVNGLVVRSLTNNDRQGLRVYANNQSAYSQLGWNGLEGTLGEYQIRSAQGIRIVTQTASGHFYIQNSGNYFSYLATGNAIVGGFTDAGFRLDVQGTFRSTLDANINGLTVGKGTGSQTFSTALGVEVMTSTVSGNYNTAIGYRALRFVDAGGDNTAVGYNTGGGITTGSANTIVGSRSGSGITTNSENTLFGASIGVTSGAQNTIVGAYAGNVLSSGSNNTFMGWYAGVSATTSSNNTGIGRQALGQIITGANNTALGSLAGRFFGAATSSNTTSSNSIYLGYSTRASADGNTNETVIGYDALGNGSNSVTLGNTSVTKTVLQSGVLVGTTTSAGYALDVNGTARVQSAMGINAAPSTSTATLYIIPTNYNKPAILIKDGTGGFVNAFQVQNSSSEVIFDIGIANGQTAIGTTHNTSAYLTVNQKTYGPIGLVIKPQSSGFVHDLMQIQDNTGAVLSGFSQTGRLYIGNTSAETSAALSVKSTTLGFLPPRMTGAQAEAIATPAAGLLIYCNNGNGTTITSTGWWGYETSGWVKLN